MNEGSPALLLIGHGSRSPAGVADYWRLAQAVRAASPGLRVGCGFIELAEPGLDEAIDTVVAGGAGSVVGVPLVLLGAGHLKTDGPAALARARLRYPTLRFGYARDLGIHPVVLSVASDRIAEALAPLSPTGPHVPATEKGAEAVADFRRHQVPHRPEALDQFREQSRARGRN